MDTSSHPSLLHQEDESRRCTTSGRCQLSCAPRILPSRCELPVLWVLESPCPNRALAPPTVRNHSGTVWVSRSDPLTLSPGTCSPSSPALSCRLSLSGPR